MAKKKFKFLNFISWLTGVIVSLAVGSALTTNALGLPEWMGGATDTGLLVGIIVGWIVIITTLISAILAIIDFFAR